MPILYPEIETIPVNKIREDQLKKLNQLLLKITNTPYYHGRLPVEIESFSEFSKLPFLSKRDLREAFPYGLLSCPKKNIIRFNASSGTTGTPTLSFCSQNDLKVLEKNEALHFSHAGLTANDIMLCMVGFNLFTAGWCCYHGALGLGAGIIPSGPGNTQRQIDLLKQLKTEFCFSTPGYLQHLLGCISEEDKKNILLKTAITGGEVLTREFQKLAKEKYNIEVYNFYGMTEFSGHIASECYCHNGLHVNEDCYYVEVIDPETGKTVPDGEYGELVITNLKREAMPLIRYRTRDITRIIPEACPCGRTHRRIEPITHRIDDMMIINGVNIFPSQIEECIYKHLASATNYLIHVKEKEGLKKLLIDIEVPNDLLNNDDALKKFENNLTTTLKAYITVTPKLNFIPQATLPEIQGKAKRIIQNAPPAFYPTKIAYHANKKINLL